MTNQKKIVSGISWSLMEKLLTQAIETVISILLARLLFPEDYGLISLVQIFITISTIFVEHGLGTSYVRTKDCDEEQISTVFYLNFILGLIIYALLFVFAPLIASLKGRLELVLLTRILAIKIPIASIYSMQHAYIRKRMEFKKFFFSSLIGTVCGGVVGVIMAFKGFGVWALVANTLIDQFMDCTILYLTTKWLPKFKLSIQKTKDMIDFGIKIFLSEFVNRAFEQLKPLLIALKFTVADLALNSKGLKFAYIPISLISSSITRVMLPAFSEIQNDKEELIQLAKKTIETLCFVLTPLLLGLSAVASTLIPFLLTDKWVGCVIYIQIYCLSYLFAPFDLVDARLLEARGRSDMLLNNNLISIATQLVIIILCVIVLDNPIAVSISVLITTLFRFVYLCHFCKKEVNFGLLSQIKCMYPSLIPGLIMGLVVLMMNNMNMNVYVKLICQIIVGALLYFSISYVTKNNVFMEFKSKVMKKKN